jgi:quinol monooxygenase YgiN
MPDTISWIIEAGIRPGKLDDFRTVAKDLIASAESEPGTLSYEWNLSHEGTACHIFERYENSAAVLAHSKSFGAFAHRFLEACDVVHFYIYGTPTDEVKAGLADLGPIYFKPIGGFNR